MIIVNKKSGKYTLNSDSKLYSSSLTKFIFVKMERRCKGETIKSGYEIHEISELEKQHFLSVSDHFKLEIIYPVCSTMFRVEFINMDNVTSGSSTFDSSDELSDEKELRYLKKIIRNFVDKSQIKCIIIEGYLRSLR